MPADAAEVTERWPNYQEGDFVITDYVFRTGETLPELKLHYRTLGTARRNTAGKIINGVLLLQGNTGTGANWLRSSLADELFAPGEPLDAAEYFIIMPDAIGRGGSSKPSDGLKGKFPHYRYHDMVESGYRLITDCLDVGHLRLIIGSSMGGMHAWMWAERYPDLMDGWCRSPASRLRSVAATGSVGAARPKRSGTTRTGTTASTKRTRVTTSTPLRGISAPKARLAFRKWRRLSPLPTPSTSVV
jgi:homoserine acetyltransferase